MLQNRLAQLREERAEGDRGFTLIELLVVVVIIGILIAIAIPLYLNYKKGANDKSAASDLRSAVSVLEQCNSDNTTYPLTIGAGTSSSTAGTSGAPCTGQTINESTGTYFTYSPYSDAAGTTACTATPCLSYQLVAQNSNGSSKTYTYKSWLGGSVK
ncbi:prepilin-type N-terminal cleavage/methylation domain-containing protein [uncultured Jatrophihabitans sp.]|uniref:prepilin-type N-terminal cleavage/methylation domain-containing protein n=1 Tax=uncultured Jatrophihabitans sp. TaxID=1610747 RepID=UPI0035CA6A0E